MAIAYYSSVAKSGSFVTSLTEALDAGTDDNRCVIVFATTDRGGATTISSATYGGVAMTAHTGFTSSGSSFDGRFFYLAGAASGSNNVVVTYSDGNTKPQFFAAAYSGVDGTTPIDQLTTYNSASTASPSATVTSETGDLVVFMCMYYGRTASAPTAPATERFDALIGNSQYGFLWDEAGAASVTIDGTITGGAAEVWGASFNFNAAAAAGGVPATNRLLMGVG